MRKFFWFLFLSPILISVACGQEHEQHLGWLADFKNAEKEAVLLKNAGEIIPLKALSERKIASVNFGFEHHSDFDSLLNKYAYVKHFNVDSNNQSLNELNDELKLFNTIIISVTDNQLTNAEIIDFIKEICEKNITIISLFGNGRSLMAMDKIDAPIVWMGSKYKINAGVAAQIIFGGIATNGKLLNNYGNTFKAGDGFATTKVRLAYTVPEDLGLNSNDFIKIDEIADEAMKANAAPGMVVLIAKNGKVIYNKSYGYHTYEKLNITKINDIFDLASVTKTSATTMEVMRLYERKQLDLDTSISTYLAQTRGTDKAAITPRDLMLHQAGFIPYIPFFMKVTARDYLRDSTDVFNTKVADSFYMERNYYKDIMWKQMLETPLKTKGQYVYSDISMYYMKEIVEKITKENLPNVVTEHFYKPLGMHTTGFNPRNRFKKSNIIPTELDLSFRKTLVWGYVHDQGAAMVGGVSGHAGLFSNANDLAKLYQMMLNGGSYGGEKYLDPATIQLFTTKQSDLSRRGLGFDRWDPDPKKEYPSKLASPQTYGHTGYTGTCVWVDPKEQLIYIFLSNRVYPKVTNTLSNLNIRGRIQDVVYKAIEKVK